ncbi:leucine rich repeat [Trypanosoma vivax]|uniref:Calpain-like cysteine peptidase n=1 Tax=Trypanosoma vivax (strain Y486) TaxID=1055687 RepID=G0TR08_TRYVY|nr:hypothetical protein TRVL_04605 [Trypanosoma vivax]KAH8611939.1 leucine rich repeat [Trypanosoma vivax]CCC46372.1 conserved hypothetical protein [Trypanosoma vivax Y486]
MMIGAHNLPSTNVREVPAPGETLQQNEQPYNVEQLQAEFHVLSPRETYHELCHRSQCRPISTVALMFSPNIGQWNVTTNLDFSHSYIGPRGVRPVVEICKRLPALKSFNCANNYLTNDSVYYIMRMAIHHPALEHLELSGNAFISWTGGNFLVELSLRNNNIKEICILETAVPLEVSETIFKNTRRNCALAYQASGLPPKATSHPTAIHLRAMKRFFMDMQKDGTVHRSMLAEGYKERLRILGQEHSIASCSDTFFEEFCNRVPMEWIPWEAFVITVKLDGAVYDEEMVKNLRRVFLEFNVMPLLGVEGFVMVRDLAAVYTRLYGMRPTQEVMDDTYGVLGLDDTMTLHWDEFLVVLSSSVVRNNKYSMHLDLTPSNHSRSMLHF